jgi:energy-coupling factor transport system ATP-binding protein
VVLGEHGGIVADGDPATVLAADGARLASQGVWVPGHEPRVTATPTVPGRPLLTADDLRIARGSTPVRAAIDLAVAEGDSLVVTGPNGAGKSTLALTLAGLLPPAGGGLRAEPALASGLGPHPIRWRSRDLLRRIGSVFQAPEHQFVATTVREELAVGPRALGADDARAADDLLELLGLAPLAEANPFTLSGGQQRRLSVGTALATAPRLLVLDEPTFGQDALTWAALVALLNRARERGSALVAMTHDPLLPDALGARRLVLEAVPA